MIDRFHSAYPICHSTIRHTQCWDLLAGAIGWIYTAITVVQSATCTCIIFEFAILAGRVHIGCNFPPFHQISVPQPLSNIYSRRYLHFLSIYKFYQLPIVSSPPPQTPSPLHPNWIPAVHSHSDFDKSRTDSLCHYSLYFNCNSSWETYV